MGCILACFRFKCDKKKKKNKAHLKSSPVPSKSKEPLLLKEPSVSVFISEGSSCEQVADLYSRANIDKDILEKELRDEVKFLKSCGTILETPPELQMESDILITNKDTASSSSLRLPGTLCKDLVWDEQHADSEFADNSYAGFKFGEYRANKLGPESALLDVSPSKDEIQIEPYVTKNSVCLGNIKLDPETEPGVKSVMLDVSPSQEDTQIQVLSHQVVCLENAEDPGTESELDSIMLDISPSQEVTQVQPLNSKNSPYPTPLKLTDEMETPGTIYQASTQNMRRKNARVRTQYVYPVVNPVENLSQQTEPSEAYKQLGGSDKDKRSPNREEFEKENLGSVKRLRSLTPLSDSRWKAITPRPENEEVMGSSLSQWLQPPSEDEKKNLIESNTAKYLFPDRTPEVDRPILGAVAMHWNEEDNSSKVSPKWWGGNGIPNTTTKYKEDQKVSWHATPFEERLDKALSNDKLFPHMKDISRKLVAFNSEDEEK